MKLSSCIALLCLFSAIGCGREEDTQIMDAATDQMRLQKCVGENFLQGIDVSEWQETVDWSQVAAAGYDFTFTRVSYGREADELFPSHWQGAKNAGLIRGAYQYFLPAQDVNAQVDLLVKAIGPRTSGDLPPVLDVEDNQGLDPASLRLKISSWVNLVKQRLGVDPIIYSGIYFWRDFIASSQFITYKLWLPWYSQIDKGLCPQSPTPWKSWSFWQWTDQGRVPGIPGNVDMNVFRGTRQQLQELATPLR